VITLASPTSGRYYFKVKATADASGVFVRARIL